MSDTETAPSVEEMLSTLLENQKQDRAEMAQLRDEVAASRRPVPVAQPATRQSAEELLEARMAVVAEHSHYCPGCGRLSRWVRECVGTPEAPHPPIEMISTDELKGDDPSKHTPAPNTDNLG